MAFPGVRSALVGDCFCRREFRCLDRLRGAVYRAAFHLLISNLCGVGHLFWDH